MEERKKKKKRKGSLVLVYQCNVTKDKKCVCFGTFVGLLVLWPSPALMAVYSYASSKHTHILFHSFCVL